MPKRSVMTVDELKQLYSKIGLMEGYDSAIVGIVPSPDNSCIAVYDSMKIISMLGKHGFKSQKELIDHFNSMVESAQKNSKIGPLFMQMVAIRPEYEDPEGLVGSEDDEKSIMDYEQDFDPNYDDKPFPDYDDEDSDSSSDSDIEYIDDSDSDSGSEEYYEEEILEDYDEDPDAPYMEITVDIGTNDPKECQIVRSSEKIKEAIGMIFPNLPRLDMVAKAKFVLRNIEDMD